MIGAERDFWPLPTIVSASVFADRRIRAPDRQRLGDAQARAVAQSQHRGVARQHPRLASLAFPRRGRGHRPGVGRAQGSGQSPRRLWRADGPEGCGCEFAFARNMSGKRFEGGERALQRAALDSFRSPIGEKGAQVARGAVREIGDARRRANAFCEEGEELPGVAAVSLDRASRQAPFVGEMDKPGGRRRGEVGRGGQNLKFVGRGGVTHGKDDAVEGLSGGCGHLRDIDSSGPRP